MFINVAGAYGRSYTEFGEAQKDWDKDLDFRILGGPYINKSDYEQFGEGKVVNVTLGNGRWERLV